MSVIKRATELEKWRADHVLRALWRVAHERQRWFSLPPKPLHLRGINRSDLPGIGCSSAAYLVIWVEELPPLGIDEHTLRLYRGDYARALDRLSGRQRHELKYHLAQPRYSSVFRYHRREGVVRLNDVVDEALGEAALTIVGAIE